MEILTPFQKRILKAIGHSPLSSVFYLTGGTTLAAYYLQHRFSEDLDFFTDSQEAVTGVTTLISDVAQVLEAEIDITRTFPTFVECFLQDVLGERVKMDFAFDTPFRLLPTQIDQQFEIHIDNVTDISCNKLSALFGRAEAKDFVDVYFICQELMPFSELYPLAQQKHVGMTNYWLAQAMRSVKRIQFLPRMIKPVTIPELNAFFLNLAQELMNTIDDNSAMI